ncbi:MULTISPECIES: DUF2730 family protein [Halomonas]|uniref:DUF2730 domain-containing protein n=1 Tax=Halomonas halophila TaxID=29573 RepID=A0ABQ0TZW3_9GAMM|nr:MULTISPECIES: DUF2730 family protein [Halomonas]MDR5889649.1 DUF2730 family protein [Halomonas salina]WJY06331.1 DUF2730 family protein [Halomonas halophila]GEK71582.1 hypothetical protein HHA04nite_01260 [Halomonas halophila]
MEGINWTAAKVLFDVAQALFMAGVAFYVWWTNKHRATGKAIAEVNGRIDDLDKHVSRIEQTLDNRPGYSEIEQLRTEMATMNRGVAELAAQMQSSNSLLNRLHEYLLTERGKS